MANNVQVPATVESTHQMVVAVAIMGAVGMLAVILAGQSKTAGNAIAGVLGIMLVVQGITHVNPFVHFLTAHPLVPTPTVGTNKTVNSPGAPSQGGGQGHMRAI